MPPAIATTSKSAQPPASHHKNLRERRGCADGGTCPAGTHCRPSQRHLPSGESWPARYGVGSLTRQLYS
jgi:hypothetical protein